MNWLDKGCYMLSLASQGTPEWLALRKNRITMSLVGAILGWSPFTTPEEAAKIIRGETNVEVTPAMAQGIKLEPEARRWYENKHQVHVEEVGLAVCKQYPWLGASSDGLVGEEGCVEIKCPQHMYRSLLDYNSENDGYQHIIRTHYAQMQGQ